MKTSDQGRRLLIERESSEREAYPDPVSPLARACQARGIDFLGGGYRRLPGWESLSGAPWTIGVGHTGPEVRPGLVWTEAEIDAAFEHDLERFERAVTAAVRVPLEQHQFDALVSFAHNCGERALAYGNAGGPSSILRALNAGDYAGAAAAFDNWRQPPSITTRRNGEREQFRGTRFEARVE